MAAQHSCVSALAAKPASQQDEGYGRVTPSHVHTKDTEMGKLTINEIGNQYGRLKVLSHAGLSVNRKALWLCSCECGKTSTILGADLRRGTTKSCGCLQMEYLSRRVKRKKMGRIAFKMLEVEDFE